MSGILGFVGNRPRPVCLQRIWRALRLLEPRGLEGQGMLLHNGSQLSRFPLKPLAGAGDALNRSPLERDTATALLSCWRIEPDSHPALAPLEGRHDQAFLAFDGRLDNEPELICELQQLGHNLKSSSQLDVLFAALERWGSESVSRLIGTFAIAFLNLRSRRLVLARDPYGTRPLYFACQPGWGVYFSSQIDALLEAASLDRRVNHASLYRYLRYNSMDQAQETFFQGVEQVPAGHILEVPLDEPTKHSLSSYRRSVATQTNLTREAAAKILREMVIRSVASQVAGQKAVGAALSGGFDSSFVAAAFRHAKPAEHLKLYTCVTTTKRGPFMRSEEPWAILAAEGLQSPLNKIRVTSDDLPPNLESIVRLQEEPFSSPVVFAQWQLFRAAQSDGVRLMLSGQGGDTIFSVSNERILLALFAHIRRGRLPSAALLLRTLCQVPEHSAARLAVAAARMGLLKNATLRRQLKRSRVPEWLNQNWFALDAAGIEEQPSFPMLRLEDRNATACSLLNRMPLLTTEIHDFISSLPPELLVSAEHPIKSLESAAMHGMVPDAILARKERAGFPVPVTEWLDELAPWVDSWMTEVEGFPFLVGNQVRQIWQRVRTKNNSVPAAFLIWRWVFLAGWFRHCAVKLD